MKYGKIIKKEDNVFEGKHPNGIHVNYVRQGIVFGEPTVGLRLNVGSLYTSMVENVEVVNDNFTIVKTENSVYHLYTGKNQNEADFAFAVGTLVALTEKDNKEGTGFTFDESVSMASASEIFKQFGFEMAIPMYNGWQLDFDTVAVNTEGLELEYTGSLWYMTKSSLCLKETTSIN